MWQRWLLGLRLRLTMSVVMGQKSSNGFGRLWNKTARPGQIPTIPTCSCWSERARVSISPLFPPGRSCYWRAGRAEADGQRVSDHPAKRRTACWLVVDFQVTDLRHEPTNTRREIFAESVQKIGILLSHEPTMQLALKLDLASKGVCAGVMLNVFQNAFLAS